MLPNITRTASVTSRSTSWGCLCAIRWISSDFVIGPLSHCRALSGRSAAVETKGHTAAITALIDAGAEPTAPESGGIGRAGGLALPFVQNGLDQYRKRSEPVVALLEQASREWS